MIMKIKKENGAGIRARRVVAYVVLILLSFLCLIWFYFIKNFQGMQHSTQPIMRGMLNSLIVAATSAVLCTYFSTMTAYAIHAYRFRMRKFLYTFILAVMMIPTQVTALGFIRLMLKMGLMDNFIPFRIFNVIVLPLMKPAIAVQAIFTFVANWNNYFTPSLILKTEKMKTLPVLLAELRSADFLKFDMGIVYMTIAFSIFPVIIVYLILSKQIVGGVTLGGVKE